MNNNYNLLKILDALLTEVHVTKAGERVFLTQAATSNALSQLRKIFSDPLLVRKGGGKMYLTPLAKSIRPQVNKTVLDIEALFNKNSHFDPITSTKIFTVGMSDYIETVFLEPLLEAFYKNAPNAELVVKHLNFLDDINDLEQGNLDIAIGNFPKVHQQLNSQALFADSTAFFARKNHPIFSNKTVDIKDLSKYPIISVDYSDRSNSNYIEKLFTDSDISLSINAVVSHATSALNIISKTDFITHSAKKIASPLILNNKIEIINNIKGLPHHLQTSQFEVKQYWHKVMSSNKENMWLRELIASISL